MNSGTDNEEVCGNARVDEAILYVGLELCGQRKLGRWHSDESC